MAVTCGNGFYSSRADKRKLNHEQTTDAKDPYEIIALATVERCAKDWIELMLHDEDYRPEWMHKRKYETKADAVADLERFMLSEDFKLYTNIDGEKLLDDLYSLYDSSELEYPTKEFGRAG